MTVFDYQPSKWVPFRDKDVLERVRAIPCSEIANHANPDFKIRVMKDDMVDFAFVSDIFWRIKTAADKGQGIVLLLPNPNHSYIKLAHLINKFRVDCSKLHTFNLDEYADEEGNIAPESYRQGFLRAVKQYFFALIDPDLRPKEDQVVGLTNSNLNDYGKIIEDLGGADVCYTGPGWTGHLAFVEPDAPEFDFELEEWKQLGPRIVTLSPFTIAQNSLHGSFGMSGDLAAVPPKAATVGPKEIIGSKHRVDVHSLAVHGTYVSWQRFATRLVLHGPVTPKIPESILQTLSTDVLVSETSASDIEPNWDIGY